MLVAALMLYIRQVNLDVEAVVWRECFGSAWHHTVQLTLGVVAGACALVPMKLR